MPSSYRHFARDGDGDGQRDLFVSLPDVFASVANYFIDHQWQPGQPVVVRAPAQAGALVPAQASYEPEIGRAHVCTTVTNAHLVCRPLLEKKTTSHMNNNY